MGRGLMIALFASLGANVFLGGFVAGRFLNRPPAVAPPPQTAGLARAGEFFGAHADLSPQTRKLVRGAFQDRREAFVQSRGEARRLHGAFSTALAADPFDRAAAEAAFTDWRAFENTRHFETSMLMIDIFEQLPADERAAMIARAQERSRERAKKWRERGGFGGSSGRRDRRIRGRGGD